MNVKKLAFEALSTPLYSSTMDSSSPVLFGPGCPWYSLYETWGPANIKWCEERLCTWINEPANTWSNLGFILIGIFIFYRSQKDKIPLGKVFGFFIVLMGLGSFVYHATNNYLTQIFDFLGMYVYVYLILTLNFFRLGWVQSKKVVPVFLTFVLFSTVMIPISKLIHFPYQFIIAASAFLIIYTEITHQIRSARKKIHWEYRYFWLGIASFVLAFAFSMADLKRTLCNPTNHYFQGHALWHLIGSLGTYFSFLYYRQFLPIEEENQNQQNKQRGKHDD